MDKFFQRKSFFKNQQRVSAMKFIDDELDF